MDYIWFNETEGINKKEIEISTDSNYSKNTAYTHQIIGDNQ